MEAPPYISHPKFVVKSLLLFSEPLCYRLRQRALKIYLGFEVMAMANRCEDFNGRVAELVDALDLGSSGLKPCGFKSRPAHHLLASPKFPP